MENSDPGISKNLWKPGLPKSIFAASELQPGSVVGGAWAGRTFLLALRSPSITQAGARVRELRGRLEIWGYGGLCSAWLLLEPCARLNSGAGTFPPCHRKGPQRSPTAPGSGPASTEACADLHKTALTLPTSQVQNPQLAVRLHGP